MYNGQCKRKVNYGKEIQYCGAVERRSKGGKLWSPIFGDVKFERLSNFPLRKDEAIDVLKDGYRYSFRKDGKYDEDGEVCLFPSKDCRTWENFKAPWLHKQFEPLTPILFKHYNGSDAPMTWELGIYCRYDKETNRHIITNDNKLDDSMIIAYDDNKDLLGKEV